MIGRLLIMILDLRHMVFNFTFTHEIIYPIYDKIHYINYGDAVLLFMR